MLSYIVWDWNGTLLDDVSLNLDILNRLRVQEGLTPLTLTAYRRAFGFPIRDFYEKIGFDFAKTPYEVLAERYWVLYEQGVKACPLAQGLPDLLERLPCRHIILSASPQAALDKQVSAYPALAKHIDRLIGTSDKLGRSKIELAAALKAEGLCAPEQMVLVGDTDHDQAAAAALGCRFIPYGGGHQANNGITHLEELLNEINL